MNQEIEFELTYLAKEIPKEIKEVNPVRIMDVYIPDSLEQSHLRLRQKGDVFEITKKNPINEGDASAQIEQTIQLSKEEFNALVVCSQKRVVKDRYKVKIDGKIAEVDVFSGNLKGLILLDFEFETQEEKENFIAPEVVLCDVTQEDFIAGGLLVGKNYDDISLELAKFNYKKLV